jgi:hypothetical protein
MQPSIESAFWALWIRLLCSSKNLAQQLDRLKQVERPTRRNSALHSKLLLKGRGKGFDAIIGPGWRITGLVGLLFEERQRAVDIVYYWTEAVVDASFPS